MPIIVDFSNQRSENFPNIPAQIFEAEKSS